MVGDGGWDAALRDRPHGWRAAGLWEGWRAPNGETLRSFTIYTTEANADMARLHNGMPVIPDREAWPVWLGEAPGDAPGLLRPAAEGLVSLWPVNRAVN